MITGVGEKKHQQTEEENLHEEALIFFIMSFLDVAYGLYKK